MGRWGTVRRESESSRNQGRRYIMVPLYLYKPKNLNPSDIVVVVVNRQMHVDVRHLYGCICKPVYGVSYILLCTCDRVRVRTCIFVL